MQSLLAALFGLILLAVSLALGAVFFLLLLGLIGGFALYVFIRAKLTGKPASGMRFYRYERRSTAPPDATPKIQIIEAEFEEVEKK